MSGRHTLTVTLANGEITVSVTCHDTDTPKPCATWYENTPGECQCRCVGCATGDHGDCDQPTIEEIGHKWCQCHPSEECIFSHALDEVGSEMICPTEPLVASWPVSLSFNGWDAPIDCTVDADSTPPHGIPRPVLA